MNGAPLGTFADAVGQTLVDPRRPVRRGACHARCLCGGHASRRLRLHRGPTVAATTPRQGYRLLAKTPNGTAVWQVTAKPAPAIAAFVSGFYSPENIDSRVDDAMDGHNRDHRAVLKNVGTSSRNIHSSVVRSAAAGSHRGPRRVTRTLRVPPRFARFSLSLLLPARPLLARPHVRSGRRNRSRMGARRRSTCPTGP